ncbi:MAG: glycoside hydrolase family 5 protein [Mobilitalea sp.]
MRKINRVFTLILVVSLSAIMLFACGKEKQTEVSTEQETEMKPTVAPTEVPTEVPTAVPTEAAKEVVSEEPTAGVADVLQEMRDITSVDLVKEIKIGWNLGNTMDATGGSGILSEISWGNPVTTKEMIDTLKASGFNIIRIPTTWEKHLGAAPDYIIDEAWLGRVQEIVDYAMANDMYAIINMHHEEWHFPSYDNVDAAKDILTKTWKQIADRFKNYDEHLIFEGLNEPRQKGTNFEWNGGNEEGWDVINQLNAAFIETIRASSGNNPLRHLMIPPYAATASTNAWASFIVPEDDKIIVSIHAYTPYNFALNKTGTAKWSITNANDTREIDNLMNSIDQNFISKGIPVIIGEFGAMEKDNLESRVAWAEYYIKKGAEKGIPCIWWDNGAFAGTGELFGLLDRRTLTWKSQEVVAALMKGLK